VHRISGFGKHRTALLVSWSLPSDPRCKSPAPPPAARCTGLSVTPFQPLPGQNWLDLRCYSGPPPPDPIWPRLATFGHLLLLFPQCWGGCAGTTAATRPAGVAHMPIITFGSDPGR